MCAQTNIGLLCCVGSVTNAAVGVGMWQVAWWDCGFESRRSYGFLPVMSVGGCADRGLCEGPTPRSGEPCRVWCVSMRAIRSNNNHLQLKWVGRSGLARGNIFNSRLLVVSQLSGHVTFRRNINIAVLYLTKHFRVKTQMTWVSKVAFLLYQVTSTKWNRKDMQKAVTGLVLWSWRSIIIEKSLCLGLQLK